MVDNNSNFFFEANMDFQKARTNQGSLTKKSATHGQRIVSSAAFKEQRGSSKGSSPDQDSCIDCDCYYSDQSSNFRNQFEKLEAQRKQYNTTQKKGKMCCNSDCDCNYPDSSTNLRGNYDKLEGQKWNNAATGKTKIGTNTEKICCNIDCPANEKNTRSGKDKNENFDNDRNIGCVPGCPGNYTNANSGKDNKGYRGPNTSIDQVSDMVCCNIICPHNNPNTSSGKDKKGYSGSGQKTSSGYSGNGISPTKLDAKKICCNLKCPANLDNGNYDRDPPPTKNDGRRIECVPDCPGNSSNSSSSNGNKGYRGPNTSIDQDAMLCCNVNCPRNKPNMNKGFSASEQKRSSINYNNDTKLDAKKICCNVKCPANQGKYDSNTPPTKNNVRKIECVPDCPGNSSNSSSSKDNKGYRGPNSRNDQDADNRCLNCDCPVINPYTGSGKNGHSGNGQKTRSGSRGTNDKSSPKKRANSSPRSSTLGKGRDGTSKRFRSTSSGNAGRGLARHCCHCNTANVGKQIRDQYDKANAQRRTNSSSRAETSAAITRIKTIRSTSALERKEKNGTFNRNNRNEPNSELNPDTMICGTSCFCNCENPGPTQRPNYHANCTTSSTSVHDKYRKHDAPSKKQTKTNDFNTDCPCDSSNTSCNIRGRKDAEQCDKAKIRSTTSDTDCYCDSTNENDAEATDPDIETETTADRLGCHCVCLGKKSTSDESFNHKKQLKTSTGDRPHRSVSSVSAVDPNKLSCLSPAIECLPCKRVNFSQSCPCADVGLQWSPRSDSQQTPQEEPRCDHVLTMNLYCHGAWKTETQPGAVPTISCHFKPANLTATLDPKNEPTKETKCIC